MGAFVKKGGLLVYFDMEEIEKAGYDVTISVLITNFAEFVYVFGEINRDVKVGEMLIQSSNITIQDGRVSYYLTLILNC